MTDSILPDHIERTDDGAVVCDVAFMTWLEDGLESGELVVVGSSPAHSTPVDNSIEQQFTFVSLFYDDWRPAGRVDPKG